MTLPVFKDHNPGSPWVVTGEQHTVDNNGYIRLTYAPLKGSVSISGFTEVFTSNPGLTEYYIDYQDATQYRTANQLVKFSISQAANVITVNYSGVSQNLYADNLNEIKAHVENLGIHLASSYTVDPAIVDTEANTGTLTQILSWFTKHLKSIKGTTNWYDTAVANLSSLWNLTWTENFICTNPANGYVSPILPLTRNATLEALCLYPNGTPSVATTVTLFQGNSLTLTAALTAVATSATVSVAPALTAPYYLLINTEVVQVTAVAGTTLTITRAANGTTAVAHDSGATVLLPIANASLSTSTPVIVSLSVTGTKRDLLAYNISGAGLTTCSLTAVQEWVNR